MRNILLNKNQKKKNKKGGLYGKAPFLFLWMGFFSATISDRVTTQPFCLNPTESFAVRGLDFHPVAFDFYGSQDRFLLDGIDDTCLCRRTAAQEQVPSAVVSFSVSNSRNRKPNRYAKNRKGTKWNGYLSRHAPWN